MSQFSHSLHFPLFIFLMKLVPILSHNCPVGHLLSMLDSAKVGVRSESRRPRQHWAGQSSCHQPKLPPTRAQPVRQLNLEIARRAERERQQREPLAGERRVDDIMRAGHWEGLRSGFTGSRGSQRKYQRELELVTQQRVAAPGHGMVSY